MKYKELDDEWWRLQREGDKIFDAIMAKSGDREILLEQMRLNRVEQDAIWQKTKEVMGLEDLPN